MLRGMPDQKHKSLRHLAFIPLALLTSACWTPGPSPLERQFYQWDPPRRQASYCMVSLEAGSGPGITHGGTATNLACAVPPSAAPPPPAPPPPSGRIEAIGKVPPL
jgi:hypothetical protein